MKNFHIKTKGDCFLIALLGYFLLTITSCSGQDPQIITTESYTFSIWGNNQSGFAGQYLTDNLMVSYRGSVLNIDSNKSFIPNGIHVHFEVISGRGTIDQPVQEIPANGSVFTKWKIGTSTSDQLVTAYVSDKTGKLLAQINFKAYAFQPGRWDVISNFPYGYLDQMVRDTINKKTFVILGSMLFQEGKNYFQWEKVMSFVNQSCCNIRMDRNNVLFASTRDGKLFKSADQGLTFTECTKPIPDFSGYFDLMITTDNRIWVSRWSYPLRYSKDGGQTWILTSSGLSVDNAEPLDVSRFSTGDFVNLMSNNSMIYASSDGINWTQLQNTPKYTLKIFVTDKDELIVLNQEAGMSIYKSMDKGQTFNRVYSILPTYGTVPMTNTFNKLNGYYYVCIPGAGILKTIDFNTFELIYSNSDIRGLMIDHNGILFATNFSYNKVYCYNAD
jgi:hypothetical protein